MRIVSRPRPAVPPVMKIILPVREGMSVVGLKVLGGIVGLVLGGVWGVGGRWVVGVSEGDRLDVHVGEICWYK